jgi:phosphatidylinositol 3-kinase
MCINFILNKINNFIKSCAAYSIISYILGFGDRHSDNLLVLNDGTFLHIDYGWIFGKF